MSHPDPSYGQLHPLADQTRAARYATCAFPAKHRNPASGLRGLPGVRLRRSTPDHATDDPRLNLVMAAPDPYPHAEERRLLYVALTRAPRAVTLVTEIGRESPFAIELIDQRLVTVLGDEPDPQVCGTCGHGLMARRQGPYGAFLGCSRFPACRGKAKLPAAG